jgi:hypothetical protein
MHGIHAHPALPRPRPSAQPRSARGVLALLERIEHGTLELRLPDGSQQRFGQAGHAQGRRSRSLDWSMFERVLERGDVGFAEAWIDGDWHSPDLAALLTLLANNRQSLARAVYGQWWGLLTARLRHWLNANTRAGSRRNIMAHYDLGNDFYRQWLDPTMSYSSALYSSDAPRSMAAAQLAKYRRILQSPEFPARPARARNRLWLGRFRRNRGARGRPRSRRPDAVAGATGVCSPSACSSPASNGR